MSAIGPARREALLMAAIVALAMLFRVAYLLGADVTDVIAGDINDYVNYARNLQVHGVYASTAFNPDVIPVADTFRPPGQALLVLFSMWLADSHWLRCAQLLQIVASSATVLLAMLFGRQFLRPCIVLGAGAMLAVWPHLVVFASTLLGETLFGFAIAMALWAAGIAQRRDTWRAWFAAGTVFGAAALVNSLILLMPFACAAVMLRSQVRQRMVAVFLGSTLLLPLAWAAAITTPPESASSVDRVAMNLVQGAWPQYHQAWRTRHNNETSRRILQAIDAESDYLKREPAAGLSNLATRLRGELPYYLRWYLVSKPYALWDWNIQLGWRGIYFLETVRSPFERQPVPKLIEVVTRRANPAIFVLACLGVALTLLQSVGRHPPPFAEMLCVAFLVYVTVLHVVLQSEPRYSIPYRPEQVLVACVALQQIWTRRKSSRRTP